MSVWQLSLRYNESNLPVAQTAIKLAKSGVTGVGVPERVMDEPAT